MQSQSTNAVEATQLALLEKKIFWACPVQEVIDDYHEMYTSFMCSDAAENTMVRNHKTATHYTVMRLLTCIQNKQDPNDTLLLTITIE
jgi:hypothetical protein